MTNDQAFRYVGPATRTLADGTTETVQVDGTFTAGDPDDQGVRQLVDARTADPRLQLDRAANTYGAKAADVDAYQAEQRQP